MPRAGFEPTTPRNMEDGLTTELPRQPHSGESEQLYLFEICRVMLRVWFVANIRLTPMWLPRQLTGNANLIFSSICSV